MAQAMKFEITGLRASAPMQLYSINSSSSPYTPSASLSYQVALIRDALDDNTEFPPCSPHSIVEVLSTFLAALSKPLLPPELYPSVRDVQYIVAHCCFFIVMCYHHLL
jgi:hypothetical protein